MLDGYASSTLNLARLQFAVTTSVHFLFVILTLGLVTLVAITQTRYVVGGRPELGRMAASGATST
jgi:cytochrome d ubiquinol oxidase subunit I